MNVGDYMHTSETEGTTPRKTNPSANVWRPACVGAARVSLTSPSSTRWPMLPGRNAPCPCGSGEKYKHCCQGQDAGGTISTWAAIVIGLVLLLGAVMAGMAISGGGAPDCPPGTVWSEAHQHCH